MIVSEAKRQQIIARRKAKKNVRRVWVMRHHATHTREQAAKKLGVAESTLKRDERELRIKFKASKFERKHYHINPEPPSAEGIALAYFLPWVAS